ncbi:MAG: right-handed parallel beta-helix repeat-containing protein [Bacteroidales bacterium]|jgi:hypothetical protein|nr:right-handed parallel beta-helix repeat-containing protein [Bacteroidales bacterium]
MKTIFTGTKVACLMTILAMALFMTEIPFAGAQPADEVYSIPFIGLSTDHEGGCGWNANGSGPEPEGVGHEIPFPGFGQQFYYMASRDYDDIDPDPGAAAAHFLPDITGFPLFVEALDENGFSIEQLQYKLGLSSLGEDVPGQDWFVIGDWLHSLYAGCSFYLLLEGHPLLQGTVAFMDMHVENAIPAEWQCITSYVRLDSAWNESSPETMKEVGRAFLNDLDGEEIRSITTGIVPSGGFSGNGRSGSLFDLYGYLEKGLPSLPYIGLSAQHQGMAGWNADGTGPEPYGDGHGAQRYYVGSRDYGDIDPDPNAAFGHFLPDMKGFLNFELQLAYRNFTSDQVVIKQGLSSLGDDIQGLDWGYENGTDYWCNYYDIDYILELDDELIIKGLIDTSHSWQNTSPLYWWCDPTLDLPRNASASSSSDAQIIAAAFMKDLENRKMINDVQEMTYATGTFSGDGRYDGGFFNIETARLVARYDDGCTFIQVDSLLNCMTNYTTWTREHSPYYLDNDLYIEDGHTLNIDSGVWIGIRGPYNIDVQGRILAVGTENKGIMFTRSNPLVEWNSIGYDFPLDDRMSRFEYCTFEHSHSIKASPMNSGGAIAIGGHDSVTISHCTFRYNTVDVSGTYPPSGGAIALWDSSPLIEYSHFHDNTAGYGGALLCYLNSNPVIKHSLFYRNEANNDAGAIEIFEDCSPVLENNTITDNFAEGRGGGVDLYLCSSDSVMFVNNIIWNNKSIGSGQQVSVTSNDNIASFKYNDIEGGIDGFGPSGHENIYYAPTNIDDDPLFCGEGYISEFNLQDISPCVGTGYLGANIGALDTGCIATNLEEKNRYEGLLAFFPNPASGNYLHVAFNLEAPGHVDLQVYNLTGEKMDHPVCGFYMAGEHRVTISTGNLPSGIYIGRMVSGNRVVTAKFIKM